MPTTVQTRRKRPAASPTSPPKSRAASQSAARRRSAAQKAKPKAAAPSAALPAWGDLAGKANEARRQRAARPSLVDGVPTLRFAALVVMACALFTLYVGHVYATQDLAAEVQQLRRDHLRLVLKQNRLQGELSRMTSPAVVLERAAALGLQPSGAYGPTIVVGEE